MSKKYISEIKEKEQVKISVLVRNVTNGVTSNGAPYMSVTFQDKTGTIEGKIWDVKSVYENLVTVGRIVEITADALLYRNALQLKVVAIVPANMDGIDYGDYVAESPIPKDVLKEKVEKTVRSIENEVLFSIVSTVMASNGDKFYQYPAAAKNHHNMVAGLATHTCGMIDMAEAICVLHPELNRDLLMAGIILHDVGKIEELSGPIITEYTLKGKLIGHISLAQALVESTAEKLHLEDEEYTTLLRHMILSHHGQYEYGSPVLPMVAEAEVLNFIDNLDARLNMLEKVMEGVEPGTFSQRVFSLENRPFYKPSK